MDPKLPVDPETQGQIIIYKYKLHYLKCLKSPDQTFGFIKSICPTFLKMSALILDGNLPAVSVCHCDWERDSVGVCNTQREREQKRVCVCV